MHEGTHAVLYLDNTEYELNYYKITEDKENYFCYNVEIVISDDTSPEVVPNESYVARLVVNGDAVWYLPWVWFKESKDDSKLRCAVHGAIFCPFGLSDEEETRYDAINLIIASDVCYNMTAEVWKNLLLVFGDWLKSKSIPQYQEYVDLADEIDLDAPEEFDEEEEEDEEDEEEEDEEDEEEEEEEEEENEN